MGDTNNLVQGAGGAYIVAQSGGIGPGVARPPGMELDFYIDDLKLKTTTAAKANQSSSNVTNIEFKIYEPYGFSFITKLKRAAESLRAKSKIKNYQDLSNATRQFFVMGIRFQGYGPDGKVLTANDFSDQENRSVGGNSGGIFERFYDLMISSLKFKLDGKTTVYNITAVCTAPKIGFGIKRGVISTDTRIVADTVFNALKGPNGLLTRINEQQESLKKQTGPAGKPGIGASNVYDIIFVDAAQSEIAEATIFTEQDKKNKSLWPMSAANNSMQSNPALSVTAVPKSTDRTITFRNGMPIMQAISNIIAQSSFLANALTVLYTDESSGSKGQLKKDNPKIIKWYNLSSKVTVLEWDKIVGDFAFKIEYFIQLYEVPFVTSSYAGKTSKYYGPHKRYEYWFAGQNSEILNYEQVMDNTYFANVLTPSGTDASQGGGSDTPSSPLKKSDYSIEGGNNLRNAAGAEFITSLYDPGAYANARITIIGDPDFLVQDSPSGANEVYRQFYGQDGFTINPNGGQVFIEINFKEGVDYSNNDGLMSINDSILFWKYPKQIASEVKGVSYQVTGVTSNFTSGKFTQVIDAIINTFPGINEGSGVSNSQSNTDNRAETATTSLPERTSDSGVNGTTPSYSSTNPNNGLVSEPETSVINSNEVNAPVQVAVQPSTQTTSPTGGGRGIDESTAGSTGSNPQVNPAVASDDAAGSNAVKTVIVDEGGREI
jgi:hypothetical protein